MILCDGMRGLLIDSVNIFWTLKQQDQSQCFKNVILKSKQQFVSNEIREIKNLHLDRVAHHNRHVLKS